MKGVTGKITSNNNSGVCGVYFVKRDNIWVAQYGYRYLGCFKKKEDAVAARRKAQGFDYKEPVKKQSKRDMSALRKAEEIRDKREIDLLDDY